jgi:prepilin-type N-terminal cleavage/methylation domain-containing protein
MFKKLKGNKGFTLIELIVVIAILAILALLITPRFIGFTEKGRLAADKATCKTLETAVGTLMADDSLTGTTGKILVNASSVFSIDATYVGTDIADANIDADMKDLVGNNVKEQAGAKTGFSITITSSGGIVAAGN